MADYYDSIRQEYYDYLNNGNSSMNNITNFTNFNFNDNELNSNGLSDYYYHNIFSFEVPVLGYLLPVLVFIMTLMNIFVVGIFLRNCNKKPTTILFLSIAISDTLAGLVLVPGSIFVYGLENELLSLHTCRLLLILRLYVFPVFHTVSIWQTVALGFQRYMCVCHPFSSRVWCTMKKTVAAISVFYIMAFCIHSFHLVEEKTHKHARISLCAWIIEKPCTRSCAYMWITLFFVNIFPCVLLAVMAAITIYTMRKLAAKMENINCNKESEKRRLLRDRQINIMVVSITIAFLIPEFSNGIIYIIIIVNDYITGKLISQETLRLATAIYMVVLVVSFNFNFWVYCCMMKDFRRTVLRIFTFFYVKQGFQRLRSLSSRLAMRTSRSSTSNSLNFHPTTQLSVKSDDILFANNELSDSMLSARVTRCNQY